MGTVLLIKTVDGVDQLPLVTMELEADQQIPHVTENLGFMLLDKAQTYVLTVLLSMTASLACSGVKTVPGAVVERVAVNGEREPSVALQSKLAHVMFFQHVAIVSRILDVSGVVVLTPLV